MPLQLMLLMRVFEALNRLPFKPVASLCLLVPPVLLHVGGDGLTDLLGELLLGRRASDGFGLGWVSSMCLNPADFFGYGYGVEGGGGGGGSPWPARLLLPLLATRGVYHLYYETVSLCQKGFNLELALGTKRFGALLFLCCVATQTLYVAAAGTLATLGLFEGIYWDECCMGYTGVIFALKVVAGKVAGTRREGFFFFSVESKWAAWLELGLVHFLHPQSSLLNHVCGIVVGNGIVRLAPELAGLPPRQRAPPRASRNFGGGTAGGGGSGARRGRGNAGAGGSAGAGGGARTADGFAGGPEPSRDDGWEHVNHSDARGTSTDDLRKRR
uniref:Peptidase S54 rhomboid domain-containing protein n=1 Tax=Prasinoderma coloniale TaxID=156133 RepID=A0A7R9TS34_9VIRI